MISSIQKQVKDIDILDKIASKPTEFNSFDFFNINTSKNNDKKVNFYYYFLGNEGY